MATEYTTCATPEVDVRMGDVLDGKYVLRGRIARGGMGTVFLAEQLVPRHTVAIKILHRELACSAEQVRRFRDEAVIAERLRDGHSVAVIEHSALPDGTPYLVMEHVAGRPLGRVIAEEAMPLPRVIDLVGQVLGALGAAHDRGIVHGDVKSDNFLVDVVDGRDRVTMIDFGLAHLVERPPGADIEHGDVQRARDDRRYEREWTLVAASNGYHTLVELTRLVDHVEAHAPELAQRCDLEALLDRFAALTVAHERALRAAEMSDRVQLERIRDACGVDSAGSAKRLELCERRLQCLDECETKAEAVRRRTGGRRRHHPLDGTEGRVSRRSACR